MDQFPQLEECHFGFIGAGNMTMALVSGFINSGRIKPSQMSVSAPTDNNLVKFQKMGCHTTHRNDSILSHIAQDEKNNAKLIFLSVKPNVFRNQTFSLDLGGLGINHVVVVSVMAGVTIDMLKTRIRSDLKQRVDFVRLMPNTATSVCKGICGLVIDNKSTDQTAQEQLKTFLTRTLSLIGLCQFVTEQQINAVCGLGGSGIAFVYSMIQAMSDGALKMGLPRSVATSFAAQTVLGAAEMVLTTDKHPAVLREEVTSPGGTTIHGLHALERRSFSSAVMDAVEAATNRANQFG